MFHATRSIFAILILSIVCFKQTLADPIPIGYSAKNFDVVGYSDLDGRPGFKMSIRKVDDKWYLYLGHFWNSGWSILDVTNPATPKLIKYIEGPKNTWTLQMDMAEDKMITALEKIPKVWGGDESQSNEEGVLIWSLKDPLNPQKLGQFKTQGNGTHRNGYQGGRYVHLAAGMPGFDGNIYVIIDIKDPSHPVEVSRWWVPGQNLQAGEKYAANIVGHPSLHGPVVIKDHLAFLPYGSAGMIVLDIGDIEHPKMISRLSFSPPFGEDISVHSVVPNIEKGLVYVNSEAIQNQCNESLNQASVVDITNIKKPRLMALMPLPEPPKEYPVQDFCQSGGRFGPHNQHQLFHNPDVQKQNNLIYMTYFNAGLRVFDVSNPRLVKEAGYFLPPQPTHRYGLVPADHLTLQSEDVLVDARGYAYVTHKNQGLWILKYKTN
jgi:hypothetical protein